MTGQPFTAASHDWSGNPLIGCQVFVCGPSGAGKDSVMALARDALAERGDIMFARRMITRPAQTGADHEPVTAAQSGSCCRSAAACDARDARDAAVMRL